MASASCAGPLPPYPHSKAVGLWLRSSRRGLRGLRSPLPSTTQTTHPGGRCTSFHCACGVRQFWSAVSWCSLSWVRKPCPHAASRRRGKGAAPSDYACDGWLALSGGRGGSARATDPCGGGGASGNASVHFSSTGTFSDPPLTPVRGVPRAKCLRSMVPLSFARSVMPLQYQSK
jgi:hypothetical protein